MGKSKGGEGKERGKGRGGEGVGGKITPHTHTQTHAHTHIHTLRLWLKFVLASNVVFLGLCRSFYGGLLHFRTLTYH